MNKIIPFCFLLIFALAACGDHAGKKTVENKTSAAVKSGKVISLPALPSEDMQRLYEECDYTDYIFHYLPFSISQGEKAAVIKNLSFISPDAAGEVTLTCKPMGREFFHIKGEIEYEADVYFEDGCQYIVFMKGNTPIYLNKISEAGKKFYTSITSQNFSKQ